MTQTAQLYSVYLAPHAVELRHLDDSDGSFDYLVCSQAKLHNALIFARRLAQNKNLPLNNLTLGHPKPSLGVSNGVNC